LAQKKLLNFKQTSISMLLPQGEHLLKAFCVYKRIFPF
jgi:hypothetical protein